MNVPRPTGGWQRPVRWVLAIMALLGFQVVVIGLLSDTQAPPPAPRASASPRLVFLQPGQSSAEQPDPIDVLDPSLLGLPGERGFSGKVWMHPMRVPQLLTEWEPVTAWLELHASRLGADFSRIASLNPTQLLSMARKEMPRGPGAVDAQALQDRPRTTRLILQGGLAGFRIQAPTQPPTQPANRVSDATTVLVMLERAGGSVAAAAVIRSCGLPEMDRKALEFSRKLRFESEEVQPSVKAPDGLLTGRIEFDWGVSPDAGPPDASAEPP